MSSFWKLYQVKVHFIAHVAPTFTSSRSRNLDDMLRLDCEELQEQPWSQHKMEGVLRDGVNDHGKKACLVRWRETLWIVSTIDCSTLGKVCCCLVQVPFLWYMQQKEDALDLQLPLNIVKESKHGRQFCQTLSVLNRDFNASFVLWHAHFLELFFEKLKSYFSASGNTYC